MALRQRPGGWQVRVKGFSEVTIADYNAAKTLELDLRLRRQMGHLYREKPNTLGVELDAYIARRIAMGGRKGPLAPGTIESEASSRKFWRDFDGILLTSLRRVQVEDHLVGRSSTPVAAKNALQLLKAALRDASSRGQDVDPGIFDIRAIAHKPKRGVVLTPDELDEIGSFLPSRVSLIVPFVGRVGLRLNEALTLVDERVDLAGRTLEIPPEINKSRVDKVVRLSKGEVQILREQMMARPGGTNVVFPNRAGGIYSDSGFRTVWLKALLAAGRAHRNEKNGEIIADYSFHWLRHTAGSLMARAGMDPTAAAQKLGHNDGGALFLKRYRHLYPGEAAQQAGLVDDLLERLANPAAAEAVEA